VNIEVQTTGDLSSANIGRVNTRERCFITIR
jgi:hypothetical protein